MRTKSVKRPPVSVHKSDPFYKALSTLTAITGIKSSPSERYRAQDALRPKARKVRFGRLTLAVLATLSIASCKITVIVPAGGSVTTSSGTYTCAAGNTCDIDVVDFYFDETFTAVPADGYVFKAWSEGTRRFCGNDPKSCRLLTTVFTGDWVPPVQTFLDSSDEVFYLQPVFVPAGDIIPVNGKEWLQPNLFNGLTWDEINAVCPNGVCNGSLAGRDMTGWTWASIDDVAELLNYYIGRRALVPENYELLEVNSAWAPAFFNTGWRPSIRRGTEDLGEGRAWLYSLTRNIDGVETGEYVFVVGIENCLTTCPPHWSPENTDVVTIGSSDTTYPSHGAWFFREP